MPTEVDLKIVNFAVSELQGGDDAKCLRKVIKLKISNDFFQKTLKNIKSKIPGIIDIASCHARYLLLLIV